MDPIQYPDTPFDLQKHLVLLGRRGSEAHGTFVPNSNPNSIDDRDLMGIVIPPTRYILGLSKWEHAESIKGCWDVVLYDFRKFVGLLLKQNPNVLGMLWLEEEDYLHRTDIGETLIGHRDLFRHRDSAYASFCGYAVSQLKKMKVGVFNGYMGARRKQLVEQLGYDAKNAAHLIRLLHMGKEYLLEGKLHVRRTWDRQMLIEIKQGEHKFEEVQKYAEGQFQSLASAYENSCLPNELPFEQIEELTINCIRRNCHEEE